MSGFARIGGGARCLRLGTIRRGFGVTALCAAGQVVGGHVNVRAEYARGGGMDPPAPLLWPLVCGSRSGRSGSLFSFPQILPNRKPRGASKSVIEPAPEAVAKSAGGPARLIDLLRQVNRDAHLLDLVELSFDPVDMIFLVIQNGNHELP